MKFPSTSSQGNPPGSNPSGTTSSQTPSTTITMPCDQNSALNVSSPLPGTSVNGHKTSVGSGPGGTIVSSTPLPASTGPTSTAASMASNFFRRYTSTNTQEGTASAASKQQQQQPDLNETPTSNWRTLNETSDGESPRHAETVRHLGDISETSATAATSGNVFELKNVAAGGTNKKQTTTNEKEHRQSLTSKLHKPGKSRKNSRAPPPPQMSQGVGKSSGRARTSRLPHESIQRPCQTHSFHTDAGEVQHMEEGLLKLLDDFNSGKLRAFGQGCSMEQMEAIRDQQESLAKLHFDLGGKQDPFAPLSEEGLRTANDNMDKLMNRLERLSVAIGELNPAASAPTTPTTTGTAKKPERHHAAAS